MTKRIHSSLGYLTPIEYETAWIQSCVLAVNASPLTINDFLSSFLGPLQILLLKPFYHVQFNDRAIPNFVQQIMKVL